MKLFSDLLGDIYKKSPLQKKKIEKMLSRQEETFFEEADQFVEEYSRYLRSQDISIDSAVDAYVGMCNKMLKYQIKFMQTGTYPTSSIDETYQDVYGNRETMTSYMIGLALSQYLWDSHYEILTFFKHSMATESNSIKTYLEIGPGHGLYLKSALEHQPPETKAIAVDISPASLDITKSIIQLAMPDREVEYYNEDMLKLELDNQCSFITMGEVIEHVYEPDLLLTKACRLLSSDGKAFISTCVDAPMVDHLYHFTSVDHIRSMLSDCGFSIIEERILPVEDLPMNEIVARKITINYCAMVSKIGQK